MNRLKQFRSIPVSVVLVGILLLGACGDRGAKAPEPIDLDSASTRYLELALALSAHDPHFVASYYGPAEAREQSLTSPRSPAAGYLGRKHVREFVTAHSENSAPGSAWRVLRELQVARVLPADLRN